MNNIELTKELAKNKADEYVIKKELEKSKIDLINQLNNGLGNEIKQFDFHNNGPVKYDKPFKVRVKEFFTKISKVLNF
jgi:hypothetical protein